METPATYRIDVTRSLLHREALRERRCCRGLNDPERRVPNRLEMHSLLHILGWQSSEATGRLAVLSGLDANDLQSPWSADPASALFRFLPPRAWMAGLIEADLIDLDSPQAG